MIGLFLIYYIGKAFYELAGRYQKNKWAFVISGIVSYYLGTFMGGFLIGIAIEWGWPGSVDELPGIVWGLIALPFGILSCWLFYTFLKRQWTSTTTFSNENVLDGDLKE